jgi:FkbM family methyltransferase
MIALAKKLFRSLGIEVSRYSSAADSPTLAHALERLRATGIGFRTVIDVGASNGYWSKKLTSTFGSRTHLLLDANRGHETDLKRECQQHPNWQYMIAPIGETPAEAYFDDSDPWGGHLSASRLNARYKPCKMTTIDLVVGEKQLIGPYLLKLDTHGVEIPILNGSAQTLKDTNVLVIEVYNFDFGPPAVPFWDLCKHLVTLGFRPIDLFDILYRPLDRALWQFDLTFARSDLPLFRDARYRAEA